MEKLTKIQLWHSDMMLHEFKAKSWKIQLQKNEEEPNYLSAYKKWKGYFPAWPCSEVRHLNVILSNDEFNTYESLFDNMIWSKQNGQEVDALVDEKLMFTKLVYKERMFKFVENKYELIYVFQYQFVHGQIA